MLRLLLSAALTLAVTAAPARAAESPMPTRQAAAYGMDWVPYIDPADLPPAAERKAICLIDTGVAVTPDLPADNPDGPVVARLAVDGGSGLPGPAPEHEHGTSMASMASALAGNDWGTVGAWPGARIVSVRAMDYERTAFTHGAYMRGLSTCERIRNQGIVAVSLSFGSPTALTASESAALQDLVGRLHNVGASVVVAAGNDSAPPTGIATTAGMIPVAAGDVHNGRLCSYASFMPSMLVGPGCGIDISWNGVPALTDGGGSSAATAFVAATISLLRNLRPDASREEAERWLLEGAVEAGGQRILNGEASARRAGLHSVVDRARARMLGFTTSRSPDVPSIAPVPSETAAEGSPRRRLGPPRAFATFQRRTLRVRVRGNSANAERLRVWVATSDARARQRRTFEIRHGRTYTWKLLQVPRRVAVQLLPYADDVYSASPVAPVVVRIDERR